jgi:hypothetical protein
MVIALFVSLWASAVPDVQRIAILPAIVEGPGGSASSEDVFEHVARATETGLGLEVVSYNELFLEGQEAIAGNVRRCGSDMRCVGRTLVPARIPLGLSVNLNFALDPALASVSLFESASGKILAESVEELDRARPLYEVLAAAVTSLLDKAHFVRGGLLVVRAVPSDAAISIEGARELPGRANTFLVPPGEHTVIGKSPHHADAKASAIVAVGGKTELDLVLVEQAPETSSSLVESPWFWGTIVLAAAGVALGAIALHGSSAADHNCICVTTASGSCGICR